MSIKGLPERTDAQLLALEYLLSEAFHKALPATRKAAVTPIAVAAPVQVHPCRITDAGTFATTTTGIKSVNTMRAAPRNMSAGYCPMTKKSRNRK
mgnify:CR=1 FL=1